MFPEGCSTGLSYGEISDLGKLRTAGNTHALMGKKTNKLFDIEVLETWLNETLREAEYFDIPGCIKKRKIGEETANGG